MMTPPLLDVCVHKKFHLVSFLAFFGNNRVVKCLSMSMCVYVFAACTRYS